jgi:hypothetical protein
MTYLPYREILSYLEAHPSQWFGESHLSQLFPGVRSRVPMVLHTLATQGHLQTIRDESRRPLYRVAMRSAASAAAAEAAAASAASLATASSPSAR